MDPVRAAYIHATLGQHPKKRTPDFVETFIDHKLTKKKKYSEHHRDTKSDPFKGTAIEGKD
jgi:hypothetical protein